MLNSLFGLSGKSEVYITVSPACGLEMMVLDNHGAIKSYAHTELAYNETQREISDYAEFKAGLETLFQMRNINPAKANIHLSLPTVWFGSREGLPLLLDDVAITNIVLGELEQSYIFKRKEPMPYWFDAFSSTNSDSRNIFYSAVQKEAIDKIKEIITELGATLVNVECSLFADIKGLITTEIASNQILENNSWSLMIINNSGFQMVDLQGKKILEFYEEPLPIKSYEGEEIYTAIENAAQITLMSTPSNSLVIISETDLVSAEILAGRLQFSGETIPIEDNQYRKEPLTEMSLNILSDDQIKVSLHSIGSISPAGTTPYEVNFIAEGGKKVIETATIQIPLGNGKIYELDPQKATILALLLLVIALSPIGLAYYIIEQNLAHATEKSSQLDQQIAKLDEEIKLYEADRGESGFDPIAEIEKVLKQNRTKIMAFAALGESVPRNLYLTYFLTGENGMINVKGCADTVEDIYVFFKNMKDSLVESKLRISKLDLKSASIDAVINNTASTIDTAPYTFEITNMDDSQLQAFMDKISGKDKDKEKDKDKKN